MRVVTPQYKITEDVFLEDDDKRSRSHPMISSARLHLHFHQRGLRVWIPVGGNLFNETSHNHNHSAGGGLIISVIPVIPVIGLSD